MRLFKRLKISLDYLNAEQIEQVKQAFLVAQRAHLPQKRSTGEPYITHPVAVTEILASIQMDVETLQAALLHDVIEDTDVTKEELAQQFGVEVADLVDGVSKLTQIEFVSREEAQAENFRKMVLAMSKDIRVMIVKLADRLHNMRTLGSLSSSKRRRVAKETLEIYAPIAKRLGMRNFSVELEELGFQACYPNRYRILRDAVRKARGNRKKILSTIQKSLRNGLAISTIPNYELIGREKHLYSIYRKMQDKKIPFNEVMDVYAFRVILSNVDCCYRALGVVHQLFKPVPERFKDYIAIPKVNGYQSLHTTLFGPFGLPIEVQIRTLDMERMATSGIAAHWLYKTKSDGQVGANDFAEKWVDSLLELQQNAVDPLEFIESVKVDLFPREVYVFTPKGKILEFPFGATPVDFAYAVHTEVGNACVAAKINRQLCPLSTTLNNGETVEIITSNRGRPNPAWLDFVVTGKARSNIRHFMKNQKREESISLGRELLKKALTQFGLSVKKLSPSLKSGLLKEIKLHSFDDLLTEIGLGNRVAMIEAQHIFNLSQSGHYDKPVSDGSIEEIEEEESLIIKGTEGMAVSFSSCCHPVPGDPIVGVLTLGKGIVVHDAECARINNPRKIPLNLVSLRWSEQAQGEFQTQIQVTTQNERGALAMISLAIADVKANIKDVSIKDIAGEHSVLTFKILVRDREHIAQVISRMKQLSLVMKAERI